MWPRRIALGLALAAVSFGGGVSAAAAEFDEGPEGSGYVAGGWWGPLETESGIPLGTGIPIGGDQVLPDDELRIIPYLSHGILTEADAKAAAARALRSRSNSRSRPDGDAIAIKNVLESLNKPTREELEFAPLTAELPCVRSKVDGPVDQEELRVEHAREAQAQGGLSGHVVEVAEAVIASADSSPERLTAAAQGACAASDQDQQGGSTGYLTPQHQGTDYPD
jgi:hypothetical protein